MKWRWDMVSQLLDNPTLGAELGVRAGRFTEAMLQKHPQLRMYAIDSWCVRPEAPETYQHYDWTAIIDEFHSRTDRFGQRVTLLNMDTTKAARRVTDASLDFCFIDADHSYESVATDIDTWRPKVRPGGLLCGHDYGHPRFPGVARAVDERFDARRSRDSNADRTVWWVRMGE